MTRALPMPLRSLAALPISVAPTTLPLTDAGTTYTMAQEATFIDDTHYAVGRWDGTLSLFTFTDSPAQGPLIAKAVNSPAQEGIQAIVSIATGLFATSNDESSLLFWASPSGNWADLAVAATLSYDPSLGVANSGATVSSNGTPSLVIGHANGFVSIWQPLAGAGPHWSLTKTIDVRSAHPVNPWGLHNIRGVATIALGDGQGYVVTGSEDGNLTVIRVSDGTILSSTVYNPSAQRGINSLAVTGNLLLVANCAVGAADSNLWCYTIDPNGWTVTLTDKATLRIDPSAAQVFNFDVVFAVLDGAPIRFFCSTEECALWMGEVVSGGTLSIAGYEVIGKANLGSALCISGIRIAATAYDLHEYLLT